MRILRSLLLVVLTSTPLSAAERPNFVFILVDDLGKYDCGVEGSEFYETPHIDDLARSSLRFERGYSACQVCSPSRAAIQTGKSPVRVRITDYISPPGRNQPEQWKRNTKLLPASYAPQLALEETTVAEALKQHGYRTFFAGKWHLGGDGFTPEAQGYDINKGGCEFGSPPGGFHSPYRNPRLSDDAPGTELPARLARETAEFIRSQSAEPESFFAMLSFYSVHAPIQCSQSRFRRFQAKAEQMGLTERNQPRFILDGPQEVRQVQDHPVYAGMMAALDDAVGIVLDAVRDAGVARRTVVIFTSDNGGVSSGDGYATACLPFRGGKGRQWEGGIRQPFYIHWPGVAEGGITDVPATGMDFFPTMLDIADLPLMPEQHMDGISLVPVLKGGQLPERPMYWHYPHYGNQGGEPSAIMIEGDWKLIHYFEDGRNELYHITNDIGEQHDLAADHANRVDTMLDSLRRWQQDVDASYPAQNPRYDAHQARQFMSRKMATGMPKREKQHAAFLQPDFRPPGGWWDTVAHDR